MLVFKPKISVAMSGYNVERFLADLGAGMTVAVVALPLAMAFAIASGLPPQAGIFTSIIGGLLISLLGGSRVQIGGPAGAFIVIVYGIVQQYGIGNLMIATVLSGILLLLMGALRLGSLIRHIPESVIIGFTNGIAVLIGLSQIKDFLGLDIASMPADFFGIMFALGRHLASINPVATAVATLSLAILLGWQKAGQSSAMKARWGVLLRVPSTIIVLVLATAASVWFNLPIETIGSRFGGIPSTLPTLSMPVFDWPKAHLMLMPAFTLALLGAIESLLCARVADGLINDRHDPNQELMAQGLANIASPLFAGMPATGTVARTVTNVNAGATSPIAGIIHALILAIVLLAAAPLAASIPLAALAAILMFVAWNMGLWREFVQLRHLTLPYRFTLLSVFLLTVVFDLTVAVQFGIMASIITFLYRMAGLAQAEDLSPEDAGAPLAGQTASVRFSGALFFGSIKLLDPYQDHLPVKALLLDFGEVFYMDSTWARALVQLHATARERGSRILLCGLRAQPLDMARRVGLPGLFESDFFSDAAQAHQMLAAFGQPSGAGQR